MTISSLSYLINNISSPHYNPGAWQHSATLKQRRYAAQQYPRIEDAEQARVQRIEDTQSAVSSQGTNPAAWRQVVSYAGSDILCTIYIPANHSEGTTDPGFAEVTDHLQTITVSSARSIMPVRRLGETNPVEYTRGSRTIAGSMIFTAGLRDAFVRLMSKSYVDGEPRGEPNLFVDQMPKFSIAFQASNELGGVSSALLTNITLTNFGTTFSIDDIYTESTYTYVAEQYFPISEYGDSRAIRKQLMKAFKSGSPATVTQLINQMYGSSSPVNYQQLHAKGSTNPTVVAASYQSQGLAW